MYNEEHSGTDFAELLKQNEELKAEIAKLRDIYQYNDLVVPALKKARDIYGCLSEEVQKNVAQALGVELEEVTRASKFYPERSEESKGKYNISVCMGTACYVKGAGKILEELKKELGLSPEDPVTTEDGLFSLDACRCIGACALAPLILVNDDIYGELEPGDVLKILDKYRKLG